MRFRGPESLYSCVHRRDWREPRCVAARERHIARYSKRQVICREAIAASVLSATQKLAIKSLPCESHTAPWMSSLRKGIDSNCLFGTYRTSATTTDCRSIISLHPATIRIDKNAHCTLRRSRLRVSSFPQFLGVAV